MTLPDEELYSLLETRKFLFALLDPKITPNVPKYVRERAGLLLHHFPYIHKIVDKWRSEVKEYELDALAGKYLEDFNRLDRKELHGRLEASKE